MRVTKKWVAAAAAAALTLTSLPAVPAVSVQAADSVDQTVRLQPWNASTFNDTNGDGLGEFEGWGTSLCWWANRIGYSDALTSQAAELFFSDEGLDMNIGRYNVGGGDATGEVQEVPVNENAQFYDLTNWGTNPTGAGSSMSVDTYTKMENITYSVSDADFGLTKGEAVGSFQKIGWINYPGLPSNPNYALAKKYMPHGTCGVISFGIKGGREAAMRFMDSLKLASVVTHVADLRTCVLHPASTTHRQMTEEQLLEAGISADLIRMSVGIENIDDILEDIAQALEKA